MTLEAYLARYGGSAEISLDSLLIEQTRAVLSGRGPEGPISVELQGVSECEVRLPEAARAVLSSHRDDPLLWDYGPRSTLFGNAPLPDPPRFFHEFHELVRGQFRLERDPLRYLNWQGNFMEWRDRVVSRTYLLLTAPAPIAEAASQLLDDQ
ncbi:MAG: hypothetical protein KDD69_17945, partial [Bdellovibrionales bacterium]|nr:hypothetical protein [Bdellovibrionales bacterium]